MNFLLLRASDLLLAYSGALGGGSLRLAGTAPMECVTLAEPVSDLREILRPALSRRTENVFTEYWANI